MNPPTARRRPPQTFVIALAILAALALIVVMVLTTAPVQAGQLCKPYGNACRHLHGTTPPSTEAEPETTTTTEAQPEDTAPPETLSPSTTVEYLGEDGRPEARETEAHPAQAVTATPTFTG